VPSRRLFYLCFANVVAKSKKFSLAELLRVRGRFSSLLAVAFVESIDASGSVNQLLLAGEKRVAGRTNFNVQIVFLSRTSLKTFAARAGHCDFRVIWMYLWFHGPLNPCL